MSLELIEGEIKRKFGNSSGSFGGSSLHEHSARELLYPYQIREIENPDGSTTIIKDIDVDAKTELPNPSGTAVLEHYANYLDRHFGRGKGNNLKYVNQRYKIDMISKERKSLNSFEKIAVSAGGSQEVAPSDVAKQIVKS